MDWTWSFDWLVAGALSRGALAGGLAALAWWVLGGVWLLRRGWVRAALLLPYGLCWSLGVAHQPLVILLLFIAWLSAEAVVPRVRTAWGKPGEAPDPVAAAAAATGIVTSAGILWLGPLPNPSAVLVSLLSGGLSLLAFAGGASVSAFILWRRVLRSPLRRAAAGTTLVLAFDGLGFTPGGLGVLFLGLPVLVHMGVGFAEALRRRWPASGRRLAAATVWFLALAGLVTFSRFNVSLSERRSEEVIAACRRFESEHGRLPSRLEDLVPTYLPAVPRASWAIRGFFHYTAGASPELSYFAPWPREIVYSFTTGQRRTRPEGKATAPGQAPESQRALEGLRSSVQTAGRADLACRSHEPDCRPMWNRLGLQPAHPAFPITVGLVSPLREALRKHAPRMRAAFIFGPVAKGTETAASDLDLMVVSDSLAYADVFEAVQPAEARLARKINPTVMTLAQWHARRARKDSFASRIARQPRLFVVGTGSYETSSSDEPRRLFYLQTCAAPADDTRVTVRKGSTFGRLVCLDVRFPSGELCSGSAVFATRAEDRGVMRAARNDNMPPPEDRR